MFNFLQSMRKIMKADTTKYVFIQLGHTAVR